MHYPLRPVGLAALIVLFALSAAAAFAGSSPEEVRQFEQTKVRADAGESWSQYSLGNHYEMGSGVKKDLAQAIRWYRKSAEQGDIDGQSALANLYFEGPAEVRDLAQGVHWLRKAAAEASVCSDLPTSKGWASRKTPSNRQSGSKSQPSKAT